MKNFYQRSLVPTCAALSRSSILLASVLLLVSNIAPASAQSSSPNFDAIDAYVVNQMNAARIPGLALAIVKGNQAVHLKGFGKADEAGRAVTPQTPFIIGSTTKSFTALATMQLVEAGKIELDAPVQRYLPWFRVADPEASKRITLRHLLNQTSGLPASAGSVTMFTRDPSRAMLENQVRRLDQVALNRPVGQSFEYCNMNFMILGLIIEAASGKTYEQYIQEQVFAPLQMNYSYSVFSEAKDHGLAQGYSNWFGLYVPNDTGAFYNHATLPTGHLMASGEDMSHYLIAQLNGGRYGNTSVLSRAGMAELHKPAATANLMGTSTSYAMGWFVSEINGVPTVWVPGDLPITWTKLILVPESGWGIAVLINGRDFKSDPGGAISTGVLSMLAGRQPPPAPGINPLLIIVFVFLVVIVLQLVGVVRSIRLLLQSRSQAQVLQSGKLGSVKFWLPLILNFLWASVCLVVAPMLLGYPLFALWQLDLGQEIIVSGFIALAGGIVMLGLTRNKLFAKPTNQI